VEQRWTSYPQTRTVACVGSCELALHVGMCWRERERGPEPDGDRCRSFGDLTDTDVRARDSLVRISDSTQTRGPSTGRRAVRAKNAATTRGVVATCITGLCRRNRIRKRTSQLATVGGMGRFTTGCRRGLHRREIRSPRPGTCGWSVVVWRVTPRAKRRHRVGPAGCACYFGLIQFHGPCVCIHRNMPHTYSICRTGLLPCH
jgi:hypothetical protein